MTKTKSNIFQLSNPSECNYNCNIRRISHALEFVVNEFSRKLWIFFTLLHLSFISTAIVVIYGKEATLRSNSKIFFLLQQFFCCSVAFRMNCLVRTLGIFSVALTKRAGSNRKKSFFSLFTLGFMFEVFMFGMFSL